MKKFSYLLLVLLFACDHPSGKIEQASVLTKPQKPYEELKADILATRDKIQKQYVVADSSTRDSLVHYSAEFLRNITLEVFTYWYGTEWDFNGVTETPGKGKIACGFFVTTVLRDIGLEIPRVKWAQMASEPMIKKLNPTLKHFSNKPIETVIAYYKEKPDGIFVVGLDTHVGFVSKEGKSIKFIHSNYYEAKKGVMAQDLKGNNPINDASYRVSGQLFHPGMVKKWILGEGYE